MPLVKDQSGRTVRIPEKPLRIISLVPSQTELLFTLGLEKEVCGITKFCIHPNSWFRSKTRVGGTKNVNLAAIDNLQPDLIIANKEENEKEQIESLAGRYPVWVSDISTYADALQMIGQIGQITGRSEAASALVTQIEEGFRLLRPLVPSRKVVYLIWNEPLMTVGHDSFIHSMLQCCGLVNCFDDRSRYPALTREELVAASPDYLLLSSEPFPFKEKHLAEFRQWLPHTQVLLVDGEYFSWYGSRLAAAPSYFSTLLQQML